VTRWKQTVGEHGYRVTVAERASRGEAVYLTWYVNGKPKTESLGRGVRDNRGRLDAGAVRVVVELARAKSAQLASGTSGGLTLGQTEPLVFHPTKGLYPAATTQHHREVQRALRFAVSIWGADREWASIRKGDLRALWREKIRELQRAGEAGVRGAEIVVARVLTVARWLQDEELVPVEAAQPGRAWKKALAADWKQITGSKHDPEPNRPRHKPADIAKLIEAAQQVDPRFHLMLQLGAELRLGQVRELYRRHVNLTGTTIEIPSSGQKRGVTVYLTEEQEKALLSAMVGEGYLADDEALWNKHGGPDYALFPGRSGEPVSRTQVRYWFREAEKVAGVKHVRGRGPYGLRRAGVDGAKAEGADRDALMQFGGWTDTQMPDRVYASAEQEAAAKRARDIRAKVRKAS
jgi:integrase